MPVDLIVCVATELEGALLRPHVPVLVTGIGAVNAACALTRFLERDGAKAIINCGIAGAYPHAFNEMGIASVVCAESECYGDLGANSPTGFLDLKEMGFPLIAAEKLARSEPLFNVLPMQLFPAPRRAPFVTMNTCTGTDADALSIEARTTGSIENMEGAAIAHVATLYGIPCGEIRGISNRAGNRDRDSWRIKEATTAAQEALLAWLASR